MSIEIYYEGLCPDCQNFITQQLQPTWKKLGKYFNPLLKPFGKGEVNNYTIKNTIIINEILVKTGAQNVFMSNVVII